MSDRHELQAELLERIKLLYPEDGRFESAYFPCHIPAEGVKFNKWGDLVITMQVPARYKRYALPITDAHVPVAILALPWAVDEWEPDDTLDGKHEQAV